jgi:hypothetical protein
VAVYRVDLSTGTPAPEVKLNTTIAIGGNVQSWAWTNNSKYIAFEGDVTTNDKDELFFSDVGSGAPTTAATVHPPGPATADVQQYAWRP